MAKALLFTLLVALFLAQFFLLLGYFEFQIHCYPSQFLYLHYDVAVHVFDGGGVGDLTLVAAVVGAHTRLLCAVAVRVDRTIQRVELQLVICLIRIVLIVLLLGQSVGLCAGEEDGRTGLGGVVRGLLADQERSRLQVVSASARHGSVVRHPRHQITCGCWERDALLVAH